MDLISDRDRISKKKSETIASPRIMIKARNFISSRALAMHSILIDCNPGNITNRYTQADYSGRRV